MKGFHVDLGASVLITDWLAVQATIPIRRYSIALDAPMADVHVPWGDGHVLRPDRRHRRDDQVAASLGRPLRRASWGSGGGAGRRRTPRRSRAAGRRRLARRRRRNRTPPCRRFRAGRRSRRRPAVGLPPAPPRPALPPVEPPAPVVPPRPVMMNAAAARAARAARAGRCDRRRRVAHALLAGRAARTDRARARVVARALRQTVPAGQVIVSQPVSTQWPSRGPLVAHVWPAAHARHLQVLMQAPISHTAPGHDTPAHGSTQTPSWHRWPSGQTTPSQPPTQTPAWHTLPAGQSTTAQSGSLHSPSVSHLRPTAHGNSLSSHRRMHTPLLQTKPVGQRPLPSSIMPLQSLSRLSHFSAIA